MYHFISQLRKTRDNPQLLLKVLELLPLLMQRLKCSTLQSQSLRYYSRRVTSYRSLRYSTNNQKLFQQNLVCHARFNYPSLIARRWGRYSNNFMPIAYHFLNAKVDTQDCRINQPLTRNTFKFEFELKQLCSEQLPQRCCQSIRPTETRSKIYEPTKHFINSAIDQNIITVQQIKDLFFCSNLPETGSNALRELPNT